MVRFLTALALAAALAVPVAAGGATTVKAPKSGSTYASKAPYNLTLQVRGRSVEIVSFSFPCGDVTGRTSLNDFRLKRTPKGYRFNADAHGLVTYSDEQGDENATTHISGRFDLDAKKVRGHLRVKSKRCGDTGNLGWVATRQKASS
jgi:hypothetical protein